jgi:hypothetical protein
VFLPFVRDEHGDAHHWYWLPKVCALSPRLLSLRLLSLRLLSLRTGRRVCVEGGETANLST